MRRIHNSFSMCPERILIYIVIRIYLNFSHALYLYNSEFSQRDRPKVFSIIMSGIYFKLCLVKLYEVSEEI